MPNYNDIYSKLLQKYQDDTTNVNDMVTPEDTLAAKKYNNLATYADSLNKAMALQGSIGGKAADTGGIDLKSFGSNAMQNLALDKQAQQQALAQAKQQYDVGAQNASNRMNADLNNINMQKGQYELQDLKSDRSYNPQVATNRVIILNALKKQAQQNGDALTEKRIDDQINQIQQLDKLKSNQLNYRNAKQAESMDEPLYKLLQQAELTPGQKALDTDFAKDYNSYQNADKATADKNIQRLEQAKAELANPDNSMMSGRFVGLLPNFLRTTKSRTTEQDVRAAAQGSLKATLGSQFTEKEGERIMNAAYDPSLPPEENIKKIDAALKEVQAIKAAKEGKGQYFQQKGTLKGYQDQPSQSSLTLEDMQALQWANSNPNDPRSIQIKAKLAGKK